MKLADFKEFIEECEDLEKQYKNLKLQLLEQKRKTENYKNQLELIEIKFEEEKKEREFYKERVDAYKEDNKVLKEKIIKLENEFQIKSENNKKNVEKKYKGEKSQKTLQLMRNRYIKLIKEGKKDQLFKCQGCPKCFMSKEVLNKHYAKGGRCERIDGKFIKPSAIKYFNSNAWELTVENAKKFKRS